MLAPRSKESPPAMSRLPRCVLLPVLASLMASPALADDHDDHIRAYQALRDGAVLPLAAILEIVERDFPGRVIEIEFEDEDDGVYRYELELVTADGRLFELEFEAVTGALLSREEEDD